MAIGHSDTPRKGKTKKVEWRLRDKATKKLLAVGDVVYTFRGEAGVITGMRPPHHVASSGHVSVRLDGFETEREYYPSVIGAEYFI